MSAILAALDPVACLVGFLGMSAWGGIWYLYWRITRPRLGAGGHSAACASRRGESCSCEKGETL